jgi:hypothetical protein
MRKILFPSLIAIAALSTTLASCSKDSEDISEISQGHKYAPYEIGKYVLYDVDSTYWDDFLRTDVHTRCQLRYNVVDTFRDDQGRLSYVVDVLYRPTSGDPYKPADVIYATPTSGSLEFSQKNLKFLKLVFPVSNGKSWNGNAMIPLGDEDYVEYDNNKWSYTYANADQPYDPGNNLYEHTVTVNQIDDALNNPDVDSTVYAYRNYSQEIYAYNVGMVYKERIYWVYQPTIGARKGYEVIMKAVENN